MATTQSLEKMKADDLVSELSVDKPSADTESLVKVSSVEAALQPASVSQTTAVATIANGLDQKVDSESLSTQALAERRKARNKAANRAAVQLLCDTYPQTFSQTNIRPLKIGIQEDLVADGKVSRGKIKRGLASYVRIPAYLRSFKEGQPRIDLTGIQAGEVSASDAAYALTRLGKRKVLKHKMRKDTHQPPQKVTEKGHFKSARGQDWATRSVRQANKSHQAKDSKDKNNSKNRNSSKDRKAKQASLDTGQVSQVTDSTQKLDHQQRLAAKLNQLISKHKH